MSLESERRAIGTQLTESRSNNRAGMRASRASTFKRDLNALESSTRKQATLSETEVKGARPATSGIGSWAAPEAGSGGGIASPLAEVVDEGGLPVREYWPVTTLTSSDGLFVMEIEHIKKLFMKDANDAPVEFQYGNPGA